MVDEAGTRFARQLERQSIMIQYRGLMIEYTSLFQKVMCHLISMSERIAKASQLVKDKIMICCHSLLNIKIASSVMPLTLR